MRVALAECPQGDRDRLLVPERWQRKRVPSRFLALGVERNVAAIAGEVGGDLVGVVLEKDLLLSLPARGLLVEVVVPVAVGPEDDGVAVGRPDGELIV